MKAALARTAILVLLAAALPARGEIVDRIVAVVGGATGPGTSFSGTGAAPGPRLRVIPWSAVDEEASYQAFRRNEPPPAWKPADAASSPAAREVLQKMIDQALLGQAMERFPFAPAEGRDVREEIQSLKNTFPDAEAYRGALARYHLTEEKVVERRTHESLLSAFVDATLRPQARVSAEQVEQYYQSNLVPEFRLRGGMEPAPSLESVRGQIEEILTQEQIDGLLEQWLAQLRRNTKIEIWPD